MRTNTLSRTVDPSETLYRVVKRSRPDCITRAGKVSPALYKDANGVSVDRDGNREEPEIIRFITQETFYKRAKAIASLSAARCFEVGTDVQSAPSETNPYHANIILNTNENIGNLQALQLADSSMIIFQNEDMSWTR